MRVEYVGRAPLDGSDDRMLMATLAAKGRRRRRRRTSWSLPRKPFLSGFGGAAARNGDAPLPPERPFLLGAGSNRAAGPARSAEVTSTANKPPTRSLVRSTPAAAEEPDDAPSAPADSGFCADARPRRARPDERPGALLRLYSEGLTKEPWRSVSGAPRHCSAAPALAMLGATFSTANRFPLGRKTL